MIFKSVFLYEEPIFRRAKGGINAVSRRCFRFRFREIPTVVSLPRNDKLYTRVRHFSRIIIINKAYVRTATVIARSATRDVAIALARRGGTKCRKNSPQVTVFSQSGEATCCERGGKTYFRTRLPKYLTARIPDLTKKRHATFCAGLLARVCAILC